MPVIYAVGLGTAYVEAFNRIEFHTDEPANRRRARRALVRAANVHAADVGGFAGHWIWDLASAESDDAGRNVMRRWRQTWRSEEHAERMEDARNDMGEWLAESDPGLSEIYADSLRRTWERLDGAQRATLKAEGLRLAPRTLADDLRALPD
jgi:hypothetical protein